MKILFCLQSVSNGGVEMELLTISKLLMVNGFEVTLLVLHTDDPTILKRFEEAGVKIINFKVNGPYYIGGPKTMIKLRFKKFKFYEATKIAIKRIFKIGYPELNISLDKIPFAKDEYDFAVCYHMHSPIMIRYVAEKTKARKKFIWMHNDFKGTGFRPYQLLKLLDNYDEFIAVSQRVADEFVELCPKYKQKTKVVYNILDAKKIQIDAQFPLDEPELFADDSVKCLTVGRYVFDKGYDHAIKVCKNIVDKGIDIKWFAIGWGRDREYFENLVRENNLQNNFFLLGRKDNPYPYFRECDIYVQPSRQEGFGLTVLEAKILRKPIIATDFAGAKEQLIDGETGIIVNVGDIEAIEKAIISLIDNKNRARLIKGLESHKDKINDETKIIECFK